MTPEQKTIVKRQAEMNDDLFMDLLTWFIQESSHRGYSEVNPSSDCSNPVIVLQEDDNENSTEKSVDLNLECKSQRNKYDFSSKTQNPSQDNAILHNSEGFVQTMLNSTAPTMLMCGGSYSKDKK
jgi:hypothetical protein